MNFYYCYFQCRFTLNTLGTDRPKEYSIFDFMSNERFPCLYNTLGNILLGVSQWKVNNLPYL